MSAEQGRAEQGRVESWAVVTGASDGIGRAVAQRLAAQRTNLFLVARREDRLHEVARAAAAHGVRTRVVVADLAEPDGVRRVLEETAGSDVAQALARELRPRGVRVLAVAPGPVGTGRNCCGRRRPACRDRCAASSSVGRWLPCGSEHAGLKPAPADRTGVL